MYSNNIVSFQESTTILNACKKSLESYGMHHVCELLQLKFTHFKGRSIFNFCLYDFCELLKVILLGRIPGYISNKSTDNNKPLCLV